MKTRKRKKNRTKNKLRPNLWNDKTVFLFLISSVYIIRSHRARANKHERKKFKRFFSFARQFPCCVGWLNRVSFFFVPSFVHRHRMNVFCSRCIREPIYIKCAYMISSLRLSSLAATRHRWCVRLCRSVWMWLWYIRPCSVQMFSLFPLDHFSFSIYFSIKFMGNARICWLLCKMWHGCFPIHFFRVDRVFRLNSASFIRIHNHLADHTSVELWSLWDGRRKQFIHFSNLINDWMAPNA